MSTVAKKIVDPYNSFRIYNLVVLNQGGLKKLQGYYQFLNLTSYCSYGAVIIL